MTRSRRQARRNEAHTPGWLWFTFGLLAGLGLATLAWLGGYLPRADETRIPTPDGRDEPPIAEADTDGRERQYDFFRVLPEIEVVVPEDEIRKRARQREERDREKGPYLLQIGSFRSAEDAEGLKAQLALQGMVASIQTVTVNDVTWHRVRLGPYDTARETDSVRRELQDAGFEAMVLTGGP